jgi:GNAT superfamily N-acetyltransferase
LKEFKSKNIYDVQIRLGKKVVAHVSCNHYSGNIQIRDLYVLKKFRGFGLGEVLLSKVIDYASEVDAHTIIAYCGAEPFCEDGQIPMDQEVAWYKQHGFVHDHDVMGATPCMIKTVTQGVTA